MEILIKALQLIVSLSILVIIHEFGHFIAAKIFKTRVEKFYLFFNPWFSLFKYKPKKENATEFGVGWLPLGGYVKISGMIDESMDKEQMKKPPQPWEFRSKPSWQRLIIMLGGVLMNVALAIVIYIFMLFSWGEEYLPTENVKYGVMVDSIGQEIGLQSGDKIVSLDNQEVEDFMKIPAFILLEEAKTIQVQRNGEEISLPIDKSFIAKLIKLKSPAFLYPRFPFVIGEFPKESNAKDAGLKKDDRVIGVNDTTLLFFDQVKEALGKYKGEEVNLTVLRNSDTLQVPVNVSEKGLIGIFPKQFTHFLELEKVEYSFIEAIPAGTSKAFESLANYIKQFRLIFDSETEAYKSVGGFIAIGNFFPAHWDWVSFWSLTAFLSLMLAFINILPIPALDGGHVMFLLYEIISRRKPSEKFMEYAQIFGLIVILALVLYANGNDIFKLFQ